MRNSEWCRKRVPEMRWSMSEGSMSDFADVNDFAVVTCWMRLWVDRTSSILPALVSVVASVVDRVERFRLTLRFFDDVSTASWFTFSIPTSNFSTTRRNFSLFFLCCFYFFLNVHVNFSSVFYMHYRAVVTSSRHRPFCFHNFVFLLNCLFVLYKAHRIFVFVIAVSKPH